MAVSGRQRTLERVGKVCLAHRKGVMTLWALLTLSFIVVSAALGLKIDTSRQGMVSETNPDSARYQSYLRDFGTPLHLAIVFEGDDPKELRAAATRVSERLREHKDLVKGVVLKASLDSFRPYIPLFMDEASRSKLVRWMDLFTDPDKDGKPWRKDNCPWVKNANQADGDGDGVGDACAMDWDDDGIANDSDQCPRTPNDGSPCDEKGKRVSLLSLFQEVSGVFEAMEEGDLSGLGPYESALREIRKDLNGDEGSPIDQEAVFSSLHSMFLEDDWTEMSLGTGSGDSSGQWAQSGVDDQGYFSASDGRLLFLFVQPDSDGDSAEDVIPFVSLVEEVLEEESGPGVVGRATGNPAFVAEEMAIMSRDILLTAAVAGVGVLLLFLFVYRSLASTIAVFIPLLAGIIGCLGFTAVVYGSLNLISSSLFAIIVGLGIDFGIHLFARFRESLAETGDREEAALVMLGKAGPGVLTGGMTTLSAFLCLLVSDFHGMQQLGVLSAVGLFMILLANITLLPCLLVEFKGIKGKAVTREKEGTHFDGWFANVLTVPTRSPRLTLGLTLVVTLLLGAQIESFRFSFDVKEFLPTETPARLAYDRLVSTDAFTPDFAVMRSGSLEETREMTAKLLERKDLIARIQSAATYLPVLNEKEERGIKALRDAYRGLVGRWPALGKWSLDLKDPSQRGEILEEMENIADGLELNLPFFVSQNKSRLEAEGIENVDSEGMYKRWSALLTAVEQAPEGEQQARFGHVERRVLEIFEALHGFANDTYTSMPVSALPADLRRTLYRDKGDGEEIYALQIFPKGDITDPEFMDDFLIHTKAVDPDVTGLPVTFLAFGDLLTDGLFRAVFWAVLVILVLLLVDYRRLAPVLMTLFPLLLGTVWMLGVMHLVDMDFNFANMMGLPLILGIGVDSGVHLVHRYLQGTAPDRLVLTTGKAVGMSSLTTMVGMGSMIIATHGGMHSLGLVLLIGVMACLVTAIVVLPAALSLGNPSRESFED